MPSIPPPIAPERYEAVRGETFLLRHAEGAAAELKLTGIKRGIDDGFQLQFSLLFQSAAQIEQGSHRVQHPALGEFDLFLVPMRPRKDERLYQAVFNLLPGEEAGLPSA